MAPGGVQDHPVSLGSPAADPAALKQAPASGEESRAFPGAIGFDSGCLVGLRPCFRVCRRRQLRRELANTR